MLIDITIKNVASYGTEDQQLADLNTVNFVFGDNGSGKSTIARLIENDQLPEFKDSDLRWDAYGSVQTLVYNRQFIEDTLREKVKGVFTFGEQAGPKSSGGASLKFSSAETEGLVPTNGCEWGQFDRQHVKMIFVSVLRPNFSGSWTHLSRLLGMKRDVQVRSRRILERSDNAPRVL